MYWVTLIFQTLNQLSFLKQIWLCFGFSCIRLFSSVPFSKCPCQVWYQDYARYKKQVWDHYIFFVFVFSERNFLRLRLFLPYMFSRSLFLMGYTYVIILSYYFLLIFSCIPSSYFNWILDTVFTEFFVDINSKLGMVITFSREDLCCFCQEKEAPLLGSPPWTSFFPQILDL